MKSDDLGRLTVGGSVVIDNWVNDDREWHAAAGGTQSYLNLLDEVVDGRLDRSA